MQISIITPVFNEPRIQQTLESVRAQRNVSGVETIVIDGGSTDDTLSIIGEYSDWIDVLVSEPDNGVYEAMNKGIERASGEIVGILNADDRYQDTDVLQTVLETFEKTGTDLCYGDLVYVDDDDDVVRYWESGEYDRRRFYFGWMPPHPTVFVRRCLYERYGTFDPEFPIAADYELLLRMLLKEGVSAEYIDDVLVRMATGGQSNASLWNILKGNHEVYRAWRKHNLRGGIQAPLLKPLRKLPQYLRSGHQ
jgi:glycosyltransferase